MLKDQLKQDSFVALKNRDNRRVDVLRFLISLIDKKEMQLPPDSIRETDEIAVLQKELKNKEESREMFAKANRNDLVSDLDYEIEIVKEYLPKALSEEELIVMVEEAIKEAGNNFGMVMKVLVPKVAGRADGAMISKIVKEKISQ